MRQTGYDLIFVGCVGGLVVGGIKLGLIVIEEDLGALDMFGRTGSLLRKVRAKNARGVATRKTRRRVIG